MRRRKKPTYLNDFVQNTEEIETRDLEPTEEIKRNKKLKRSDDVDDDNDVKKSKVEENEEEETDTVAGEEKEVQVAGVEGQCSLCEERLDTEQGQEDILTSTGSSDSSYASILNMVFSNAQNVNSEQIIPRLVFSSGQICRLCKDPIKHLDLLQNKIIGLKKVILTRASKKIEGISCKQREEVSNLEPNVDDDATQTKKKKKTVPTGKKVTFENSPSFSSDKSLSPRRKKKEVTNPDQDDVQEETVDDNDAVKSKKKKRKKATVEPGEESPSVSSDKPVRLKREETEVSSPELDEKPARPRREKPPNSMSEIEKAKIKNLKSDMKFSVKKRSQSDVYIIEYLVEKKGAKYLVKWENRHESENSWESRSKIPSSVLQYYEEDLRRLGSPVPVPASVGSVARLARSTRKKLKRSQSEGEDKVEDDDMHDDDQKEESPVPVTASTSIGSSSKKVRSARTKLKRVRCEEDDEVEDGDEEEDDFSPVSVSVSASVGSSAKKARIKLKRSRLKEEDKVEDEAEEKREEENICPVSASAFVRSTAKIAQLKRSRYEEEDEDEEEEEEEEKDNEQVKKHPMMISEEEEEDEGEYIEDVGGIDFAATDTSESQLESPEEENVRKSSRTPKPKTFDESFVSGRKPKNSKYNDKESTPARAKKIVEKDQDDVEKSVRKSKRELKSPKIISSQEKPKKKKPSKKEEEEEDLYIIEALIDKREGEYLVKWLNYPSEENTWEPRSAIPGFILNFYEQDSSRLGMPVPDVS